MFFIIIAYDGTDDKALDRRMAVRQAHLDNAKKMHANGTLKYAAGILDDSKKMIGSMMIVDFESRQAMQKHWLDNEPYVTGNVWQKININPAVVPEFCL
ncbi:hypothetical protein JW935_02495 [candidate division KSB1 bacterium]|nr:hypothetical protein [candidate division KSB1 bacterium]